MIAQGNRLYLRHLVRSDAGGPYYDWMNNPEITQYLESRFRPSTVADLQAFVEKTNSDPNVFFFAIVQKDGDRHIGNIKLGPVNWIHRLAEIGIMIGAQDCWGKGYATEAISILSQFAFETLNLHKVTAGCYGVNEGSRKAFLKAGFAQEGVRKQHNYLNGIYTDAVLFGLLESDYKRALPK